VPAGARLNSETAGSMIDRLSIMALKVHAMRAQTAARRRRRGAPRRQPASSWQRLLQQRQDLAAASTHCWPTPWPAVPTSRSTASSRCTTMRFNPAGQGTPALVQEARAPPNVPGPPPHAPADRQDLVDGRRGACAAGGERHPGCIAPASQIDWLVEAPFAAIPQMHPACSVVLPLSWRKWRRRLFERPPGGP
jgi:hypothetical protein